MTTSSYRYLFGPVSSRRLGRSLGVDLVSSRTCSYNCVFCQVGNTDALTVERSEYVPAKDVLDEFVSWLSKGGTADYVTLSGSGEPTLHTRFGEILAGIKRSCSVPTVLLSNGSLFNLQEVRAGAAEADIVKVSLSAWDQESLEKVNRPHPDLEFEKIFQGLCAFRKEFNGRLWVEVVAVLGVNDSDSTIKEIAGLAEKICPDMIHLNTVVRPAAEEFAKSVPVSRLNELAGLFRPRAEVLGQSRPSGSVRPLHP